MNRRLPTGVDRVVLAYLERYGHCSRAVVRDGRFHVVLPAKLSQKLFHLLLHPPSNFKAHAWRLVALGAAAGVRSSDLSGSVFLNIAHSGLEHDRYPDLLRRLNVRPVFMVHDLIPITHPEFCRPGELEKHRVRIQTVLDMARGAITNSQFTLDALVTFANSQGKKLPLSTPAFLAPPDFAAVSEKRPVESPYFVILGTIEPRKNHLLLLQVWKRLAEEMGEQTPLLVLIGQRGWECENVVDLLERCNSLHGHILELHTCTDTDLATWLHHAQALLFPSFAEGFGLPLVEALVCGTPVVASNLAVFHEIAGDIPDYLDPLDGIGWMSLIREYSASDSQARTAQKLRMASFISPTWSDHFNRVDALLEEVVR